MTTLPNYQQCPICAAAMREGFHTTVLRRYPAIYDNCVKCGFLRVRNPDWLEEAYSDAISVTDTGLLMRNQLLARQLSSLLTVLGGDRDVKYLDFAGGYGVFTRMMRDRGFDFYWSDRYCTNLLASGFEYDPSTGPCRAVTAFEVLEHVEDPRQFVTEALAAGNADTLIFSTELYSGDPPRIDDWWYYSTETGQHIAFYRRDTLGTLATVLGMNFYTGHGIHILSARSLPAHAINLALGPLSRLLAPLVRHRRIAKTWSDHRAMVIKLERAAARRD